MANQPDIAAQWKKIQAARLCPEITSFEVYTAKYLEQLEVARKGSVDQACLVPGSEEIAAVHYVIFRGIHPWAGKFRAPGQVVTFDGSTPGADPHRIIPELAALKQRTEDELAGASDEQRRVKVVASYLGALRRIHPFLDGNTRTTVVLLYGQMTALFGRKERPALASLDFKNLLREAYQGHVGFLANRILAEEGHALLAGKAGEGCQASPGLDEDMETAWQQQRQRILEQQKRGKPKAVKGTPDDPLS